MESPVIAVVGATNEVSDSLTSFFETLFQFQSFIRPDLVPNYEIKSFTDQAELNAYIQNEKYFDAAAGYPGICFGYEIIENSETDYAVNVFMNDWGGKQK